MASRDPCPKCGSETAMGAHKCFKCDYIPFSFRSPQQRVNLNNSEYVKPPEDLFLNPKEFPAHALAWLYKYHLYDDGIRKHCIGYSHTGDEVFLPCFEGDENFSLRSYQMRQLSPMGKARYITYGNNHTYKLHLRNFAQSGYIFLVEDPISAYRLSKHVNVVCLYGTSCPAQVLKELLWQYENIVFWLDSDEAGEEGFEKIYKQIKYIDNEQQRRALFSGQSISETAVYKVNSNSFSCDPKYYNDYEMIEIINNEVWPCE